MAEMAVPITVSALNAYVGVLLAGDTRLRDICVLGEISNFKRHSSGHLYFSLKDNAAVVRCVMFRSNASGVQFDIANGSNVCARGYVSIYERDGQYQLYVQSLEPQGLGALYEKFEALKARLRAEGLFDISAKKPLLRYPRAVGVVTSPTGAAVRDIIHVLTRRNDSVKIIICPVNVQGAGAASQIAQGIRQLNRMQNADVIIVGRGGGSLEELWAFNEEPVARSIFKSRIPVISAVGHETDFTIADFAADLRAPTPSAAAEMAVESKSVQLGTVALHQEQLQRLLRLKLDKGFSDIEHFKARLDRMRLRNRIVDLQERICSRVKRLGDCIRSTLDRHTEKVASSAMRLQALSPMRVLSRGYALTRDANTNRIISSAAVLRQGQLLEIVYRDGIAGATVNDIQTGGEGGI